MRAAGRQFETVMDLTANEVQQGLTLSPGLITIQTGNPLRRKLEGNPDALGSQGTPGNFNAIGIE